MGSAAETKSMPVVPPHGRKLGIVGVSLTKARLPSGCEAVLSAVREELESLLEATGYLKDAPFSWVTVVLRFGLKDDLEPSFLRVNKKSGDLPLAIELDISNLQGESSEAHRLAYRRAVARALHSAGLRYNLSSESTLALAGLANLQATGPRGDA
jgi:hypothetical protein